MRFHGSAACTIAVERLGGLRLGFSAPAHGVAQSADAANRCVVESARNHIVSSGAGESAIGCADSPAHETQLSPTLRCPLEFLPMTAPFPAGLRLNSFPRSGTLLPCEEANSYESIGFRLFHAHFLIPVLSISQS